ncbi:MAG TPA: hypothetical protein VHN77_12115 [Phycisphaerales bacterium]|nr:hypothetical protein [Phycisphaerales bacterium]
MATVSSITFGIAHSVWALHRLLDCAEGLSADDIERDMGIGPGGVRENIAHTLEAMFFFADNFAGRAYLERDGFAERARTLAGLRGLLVEAERDLRGAMLGAGGFGGKQVVPWDTAAAGSLPVEAAVAQTFDHAALHRTQCINMLKRLGVLPVPDLDPLTFVSTGSPWQERLS